MTPKPTPEADALEQKVQELEQQVQELEQERDCLEEERCTLEIERDRYRAEALRQERDSLCWQRMAHAEDGTQEAFYRCDARIAAIDEKIQNMEPSAGPGGVREGEPK